MISPLLAAKPGATIEPLISAPVCSMKSDTDPWFPPPPFQVPNHLPAAFAGSTFELVATGPPHAPRNSSASTTLDVFMDQGPLTASRSFDSLGTAGRAE